MLFEVSNLIKRKGDRKAQKLTANQGPRITSGKRSLQGGEKKGLKRRVEPGLNGMA